MKGVPIGEDSGGVICMMWMSRVSAADCVLAIIWFVLK